MRDYARSLLVLLTLTGMSSPTAAHFGTNSLIAAEPASHVLTLKTERVIVFKDGYYLVIKSGEATSSNSGEVVCNEVPDSAILGSLWATGGKHKVVSMVSGWSTEAENTTEEVNCIDTVDVLVANVGREAKIQFDDKSVAAGVIHRVLTEEASVTATASPTVTEIDDVVARRRRLLSSEISLETPNAESVKTVVHKSTGSKFVVRTAEGDFLYPINTIRSLNIKDMRTTTDRKVTSMKKAKRLRLRFEKPNSVCDVKLIYFRPGLRWIPTYRVALLDEMETATQHRKLAKVTLQSEFINEAEDLVNVPIDIVVGVPNFRFRDVPSPLILERILRNTLQQTAPALMSQMMSNTFSASNIPGGGTESSGTIQLPTELTSHGVQDLFVYHLQPVTLAKGERAALSIFDASVPYRDLYTWHHHATRNDNETGPAQRDSNGSPLSIGTSKVWHNIELVNDTKVPWTTGSVMMMQGTQPLAQELLAYTSTNASVRIPVTVAVDVHASASEQEVNRVLKSIEWDGWSYAKISKLESLRLKNDKSVPIDVEITFKVGGRTDSVSDDGRVTLWDFDSSDWQNYRGSPAANNSSTVTWLTTIKPREVAERSIRYHYFSRQ